jgi:hypothetical protein
MLARDSQDPVAVVRPNNRNAWKALVQSRTYRYVRWAAKGVWIDLFHALARAGGPPAQVLIDSSASICSLQGPAMHHASPSIGALAAALANAQAELVNPEKSLLGEITPAGSGGAQRVFAMPLSRAASLTFTTSMNTGRGDHPVFCRQRRK